MAKNKIIYNGNTLIDLTGDTVTADKLLQGYTAHDRSGAQITGTAISGGSGAILFTSNNAEMLINQEISSWTSSTDYYYRAFNAGNIIANETYIVIFDGVSYKYTPTGTSMGNIRMKFPSSSSPDTGEPFYINNEFGTYIYIYIQDNNTHNVKLAHLTSVSDVSQYSDAVISVPREAAILQGKTRTFTPTETTTLTTVTPDSGYDGLSYVSVQIEPIPSNYVGSGITQRSSTDLTVSGDTVTAPAGYYSSSASKAVANMTLPTQTSSVRTGTNMATIGRDTADRYINIPVGYNNAQRCYTISAVADGTAGTPTATKGTVSNHSVSVTPSVTNTTGYITGGTKSGTAVTVSASELVSGSETKTQNGTYDVTNLAEIVVDVQGGGSSGVQAAVATPQSGANSYVTFGNLEGIPTSFSLINAYDITIDDTPIVSALTFDGTNYVGQLATILSNANAHAMSTGFSHSYDSHYNQINISSENAVFDTYNHYVLVYTYGGSASDIHTADVQVGSGATSITFPVTGRPTQWSCVFKSDFGTSSGYQRTIAVANDGTNAIGTYGLCLDSSIHASNTYWTASYSGGNFTISSQSTNAGGYFHQPGYYQLTYIVDESAPSYQTKTVTPTTSQQVVSPDSGFDALSQVTVNAIPSQYIIPSGNLAITENGNNINVSQYATVSVNVSGGGGSSTCDTKTMTNSNDQATSIQFTGLSGQPKWFFVRCTAQMSRSSSYSYYYITAVRYNGTNHYGNYWRRSNGTFYNDTTHYSHTYSNGTLTVSSSASRGAAGGSFYNGSYELVYIY